MTSHDGLRGALARYSETSVYAMQKMLQGAPAPQQRSGAFKRKLQQIVQPSKNCFVPVELPRWDGQGSVVFYVADMKATLSYIASIAPSFRAFLSEHPVLECIWCHDETTAGNVLNTEARLKALMFYLTFKSPKMQSCHNSSRAWIPIGCISHAQLLETSGGATAATAAFLREWDKQGLAEPFAVTAEIRVEMRMSMFISDMESQRQALACKGSAGMKCCSMCFNVLYMRAQNTVESNPQFVTIEEESPAKFQRNDSQELLQLIRGCIQASHHWTKDAREKYERCLGYRFDPESLWCCDIASKYMTLEHLCNDSMHCYFSNGICSSEVLLYMQEVQKVTGMDITYIRDQVLQSEWKRSKQNCKHGENHYWIKRLFTASYFQGSNYKGSASQCIALVALLRWYCYNAWRHDPNLSDASQSFLLLNRCIDALRRIDKTHAYDDLDAKQQDHHRVYKRLFGLRPKHHHRLHLPNMYAKHNFVATTYGCESKHRDYKGIFASSFQQFVSEGKKGDSFSKNLLPRLLTRHAQLLQENPYFFGDEFQLQKAFDESEVEKATGIEGCRIASAVRFGMAELSAGEVVLWDGGQKAGIAGFFLAETTESPRFLMQHAPLVLQHKDESQFIYRVTNARKMVIFENLADIIIPQWTCQDADSLLCIP